ncbi:MAG: hypothetical protein OXC11_00760 [Rhodospirillales bacterium]|nr:hypothetical protein [Rhodospirillales bacterium]
MRVTYWDLVLEDPLFASWHRHHEGLGSQARGLLFRTTHARLMVETSIVAGRELPIGCWWMPERKVLRWSDGAELRFGSAPTESHAEKFRGLRFSWIGVRRDDLPNIPVTACLERVLRSDHGETCWIQAGYKTEENTT